MGYQWDFFFLWDTLTVIKHSNWKSEKSHRVPYLLDDVPIKSSIDGGFSIAFDKSRSWKAPKSQVNMLQNLSWLLCISIPFMSIHVPWSKHFSGVLSLRNCGENPEKIWRWAPSLHEKPPKPRWKGWSHPHLSTSPDVICREYREYRFVAKVVGLIVINVM